METARGQQLSGWGGVGMCLPRMTSKVGTGALIISERSSWDDPLGEPNPVLNLQQVLYEFRAQRSAPTLIASHTQL